MRKIGIVGGMSPESTVTYYQRIVRRHQEARHDHAYPRIVIASVSFGQYVQWQHDGCWREIARGLQSELESVASAGADFAILATNTMHKVLHEIYSPIPLLSIMDAVAEHAKKLGVLRLGLTGTKFTMSDGFYARALEDNGLGVVVPNASEQDEIHRIIYEELIAGRTEPSSAVAFAEIVRELARKGAEAVVLGCTELGMLTETHRLPIQEIDSAMVHADAAWERAAALT